MALHGGVIPACGTFFVFSDYMKPAVRMAALMEVPVKFIWTHDAFRVGEDGPTHEPVEQEAQIRLMEKLKNHKGHNSMLVLRPADAEETTIAWKLAMENTTTPTGLIFSRQDIAMLPAGNDYSQAAKGAYIVAGSDENPDVILVASGSEVSTLVAGTELLRKDGVKVRIVSAPSEGLFRSQAPGYQEGVIPADAKVFGLTAGLPVNLQGLQADPAVRPKTFCVSRDNTFLISGAWLRNNLRKEQIRYVTFQRHTLHNNSVPLPPSVVLLGPNYNAIRVFIRTCTMCTVPFSYLSVSPAGDVAVWREDQTGRMVVVFSIASFHAIVFFLLVPDGEPT